MIDTATPNPASPRLLDDHVVSSLDSTSVFPVDEVGPGGAHHVYRLVFGPSDQSAIDINFQRGPRSEFGPNGITDAALLNVLVDRARALNSSSPYAKALEEALSAYTEEAQVRDKNDVRGTSLPTPEKED